jgi:hypothetical protein
MKRLKILFMLFFALVPLGFSNIVWGQVNARHPYHYLIPDGYVGWVKVEFNVKNAPTLPFEDGHYIFKIPNSGLLQTSSDDEIGFADDKYFYVSGSNKRQLVAGIIINAITMIWSGYGGGDLIIGSTDKPLKYIYFFVGPKDEYEKYKCKQPQDCLEPDENGDPKVGNKKLKS